jgi:hypothetical protein
MSNTGIMYAAKDFGKRLDFSYMSHRYGLSSRTVNRSVENKKKQQIDPTRYVEIKEIIEEIKLECAEDDWDGEGSLAVDPLSAEVAFQYLSLYLTRSFPLPYISCDPSGRVTAEWHDLGKHALAAIAFKPEKEYLIVGYSKRYPNFSRKTTIPEEVLKYVEDLIL